MLRFKENILMIFTAMLVLLFVTSCSEEKKIELVPKDDDEVTLSETETITIDSVQVTVSSDSWVGSPEVRNEVTPLKITVANNNENPIKITYDNMKLVSEDSTVFTALPIYNLIGTVNDVQLAPEHNVIVESEIDHDRFYIYPMYTRVYNNIPITDYKYFEDPSYYSQYYSEWNETGMPTAGMRNLALPEGILDNGGSISGFVYFQKVDADVESVELSMDIINAENNEVLGNIQLPFWVMLEMEAE